MDHARPRQHRSRADAAVDLGNEPPLSVDGGTGGVIDRRRVSVQWFSGTILTGVCGAALMGGAVFASLDGETNFATVPERVESSLRGAIGAIGDRLANHKSDRLPPAGETSATRHVLRISTTTKVGDREVVRTRPIVRVSANLTMTSTEFAASVPPFNAQKLLALAGADGVPADDQPSAEPDAEVSYVTRDLAGILPRVKIASALPIDDIIARVRDTANWNGGSQNRYQVASLPSGGGGAPLAYAADGTPDPYAGFETRIVPENITLLPKTGGQVTGGNGWNERSITVKKGDSIATILKEIGAAPDEIAAIAAALGVRGRPNGLKEGQKLRLLAASTADASRQQPIRVIVMGDSAIEAVVALSDMGKYVSVDVASMNTLVSDASDEEEDDGKGMRLYQSIYETALRNNIPKPVIEALMRIYSYDVDFQHKTQPGDSFDVLYAQDDETTNSDAKSEVMFATLTTGGEVKKYIASRPPTTASSTTTTKPEKARRSSWCASPSQSASCGQASAPAIIHCSATSRCTPASTGPRRSAHRSTPPATAPSRRSAGNRATANTSRSSTPMATRPPTAT